MALLQKLLWRLEYICSVMVWMYEFFWLYLFSYRRDVLELHYTSQLWTIIRLEITSGLHLRNSSRPIVVWFRTRTITVRDFLLTDPIWNPGWDPDFPRILSVNWNYPLWRSWPAPPRVAKKEIIDTSKDYPISRTCANFSTKILSVTWRMQRHVRTPL